MSGMKMVWHKWRKWIIGTLVAAGILLGALVWLGEVARGHRLTGVAVRLSVVVRSVGVERFVERIDPALSSRLGAHGVDLGKVENLPEDFKEEFVRCEVIGERSKPQGLVVGHRRGGTFYLSLDGAGVPAFFADYQSRELYGKVYQIYRTKD